MPPSFMRRRPALLLILLLVAQHTSCASSSPPVDLRATEKPGPTTTDNHINELHHSRCLNYKPLSHVSREDVLTKSMARRDRQRPRSQLLGTLKEFADPATWAATHDDDSLDHLMDTYGDGIGAQFVGPSVVFFSLSLMACPFFLIARCCFPNTCCNGHGPYTPLQQWWPLLAYVALATISVVFACLSTVGDLALFSGITGTLCEVELLADDLQRFSSELKEPLGKMQDLLVLASGTFQAAAIQAGGLPDVVYEQQLGHLNATLFAAVDATEYAQNLAQRSTDAQDKLGAAARHLSLSLDDFALPLAVSLDNVQFNLLNNSRDGRHKNLVDVVSLAKEVTVHLQQQVDQDARQPLHEAQDLLAQFTGHYVWMAIAVYCTVFLAFVTGLTMVAMMLSPVPGDRVWAFRLFTCSWGSTYVFMVTVFLLSGIMFPLTVLSEDMCVVVADIPNDLSTWGNVTLSLFSMHVKGTQYDMTHTHSAADVLGQYSNADAVLWTSEAVNLAEGCFATPPRGPSESLGLNRVGDLVVDVANIQGLLRAHGEDDVTQSLEHDVSRLTEAATQVTSSLPTIHQVRSDFIDLRNQFGPDNAVFEDCNSTACLTKYEGEQRDAQGASDKSCVASCLPNAPQNDRSELIADVRLANSRVSLELALVAIQTELLGLARQMSTIGAAVATTSGLVAESAEQVTQISEHDNCEFVKLRFFGVHKQVCDEAVVIFGNLSAYTRLLAFLAVAMLVMSVMITNRVFEPVFMRWDAKAAMRYVRRLDSSQVRQMLETGAPDLRVLDLNKGAGAVSRDDAGVEMRGSLSPEDVLVPDQVAELLEHQRAEYERQLESQRAEFERLLTEERRNLLHAQTDAMTDDKEGEPLVGWAV